MSENLTNNNYIDIPVVPLRGLVVFPEMMLHFDVGRKKSVNAIKNAMRASNQVFWLRSATHPLTNPELRTCMKSV